MSNSQVLRGGVAGAKAFSDAIAEIQPLPKGREGAYKRALDRAKAEGYQAGHAEGLAAGLTHGREAGFAQAHAEATTTQSAILKEFVRELQEVHDNLELTIKEWFTTTEVAVEEVAVEIARKLIAEQLTLDRSFIVATTKAALRQLSDSNSARIRVNPFDVQILNQAREDLLAASASLRGVEIVADDSIRGGCLIETERGAVDATVDTRLKLLEGGMEEAA